jgi:hypothetical protein
MLPSLLQTGTVQQVKDECLKLIETIGSDGGFIMASSCPLDEAKIENVRTGMHAGDKETVVVSSFQLEREAALKDLRR